MAEQRVCIVVNPCENTITGGGVDVGFTGVPKSAAAFGPVAVLVSGSHGQTVPPS